VGPRSFLDYIPAINKDFSQMQLTVNGVSQDVPDGFTVRALIEHLGLTEGPVAVECNREVVPRAEHETTHLQTGDVLEIVHFVGGG
jgi:sulfur carrier protein